MLILVLMGFGASGGCGRRDEGSAGGRRPDAAATTRPRPAPHAYARRAMTGARGLAALRSDLGEEGLRLVLMLNRKDLAHLWAGDTLVVPDRVADALEFAPFPGELEAGRGEAKLVLVSVGVQAFAAYEGGRLVRWGPVSTGRRVSPTPPGLYHANWKARERRSTVNDEWLLPWVVNIQNFGGVSLHQYDLPGYPASHSCIRLLEEDARWIYEWVDTWTLTPDGSAVVKQGTPVVVFGAWDWKKPAPWRALPENPEAASVSDAVVHDMLARYSP
jgi:lipoprotein-anchoring transpeptidase ErfK/SrfK